MNEASGENACDYDESKSGVSVYNYYQDYDPRTRITVPTRFVRAQSIYGTYDIYRRSPLFRGHGMSAQLSIAPNW